MEGSSGAPGPNKSKSVPRVAMMFADSVDTTFSVRQLEVLSYNKEPRARATENEVPDIEKDWVDEDDEDLK
jgi:hypothetical protein